ncbi:hypothetical protein ACOME3_001457 [Neoechinorhynchus agilis]
MPLICGPKMSIGCSLISFWGTIQMMIMALCFRAKSANLLHQTVIARDNLLTEEDYAKALDDAFNIRSSACWFSCAMFAATFALSFLMVAVNFKLFRKRTHLI